MTRKLITFLVLILILSAQAVFTATPALAATITVTSKLDTADPGRCRLRDAITAANTNTATGDCPAGTAGMDTIGFSLGFLCSVTPCTITLTSVLPTVAEDLTISGSNTIISGANSFRVFDLGAVIVDISNLSIANGNVAGVGGAINMSDVIGTPGTTLTLTNVFFSGNHADYGGAIYEPRGTLTIIDSNFSGNTAGVSGGAILEERSGSILVVDNSTFNNNTAVDDGGAMGLVSVAFISHSTFSGNSAAFGGAISKVVLGDLHLNNNVFNNNAATGQTTAMGGAIYIYQNVGTATLTNVTLSGNSAMKDGGGIHANLGTINLNNVTITNNTADSDNDGSGDGGGIFRLDATVQAQNSIIAGNFDTPGNNGGGTINPDCSGTFLSQGYNLIGRDDGCDGFVNGVNGDKVGTGANPIDPLLGALANNGGTTQTHALLPGSPAMDAGNPLTPGSGGFACDGADQRGITRPQGSACDIGAFEFASRSLYLPLIRR
jgi:predicted outer membrane repeat protein